jgi:hypothetical protein
VYTRCTKSVTNDVKSLIQIIGATYSHYNLVAIGKPVDQHLIPYLLTRQ